MLEEIIERRLELVDRALENVQDNDMKNFWERVRKYLVRQLEKDGRTIH
tara:strand:+ start:206 stop:352 length:147 start_codon:yes stop_codon:yes gene_type:complete